MNKQFEKLPEIAKNIDKYIFCEVDNKYKELDTRYALGRIKINGAWYAYQEQQKRIDKANEIINNWKRTPEDIKYGGNYMLDQLLKLEELLK